ncbi:uncharacterized protein V6R79_005437 [Siganus canaliculatus]
MSLTSQGMQPEPLGGAQKTGTALQQAPPVSSKEGARKMGSSSQGLQPEPLGGAQKTGTALQQAPTISNEAAARKLSSEPCGKSKSITKEQNKKLSSPLVSQKETSIPNLSISPSDIQNSQPPAEASDPPSQVNHTSDSEMDCIDITSLRKRVNETKANRKAKKPKSRKP